MLLLINEAEAPSVCYVYEPFGTTTSSSPGDPNAFRFTGREQDETGLYYYRARYYSPALHRFVSPDPLRRASESAYTYAANNPSTFADPSGLDTIVIQGGLPSSAPGGTSTSSLAGLSATNELVQALQQAGEPVLVVTNSQDIGLALSLAQAVGMSGETLNIIGFSAGGQTAVELANLLNEQGIAVGTLATIDTVSINAQRVGPDATVIPANVETNLNFYQNQTPVLQGAPNTARDPRTSVENIFVPAGHMGIAENPSVIEKIVNRIRLRTAPLDRSK